MNIMSNGEYWHFNVKRSHNYSLLTYEEILIHFRKSSDRWSVIVSESKAVD